MGYDEVGEQGGQDAREAEWFLGQGAFCFRGQQQPLFIVPAATFLLWGACTYRTEYVCENFPTHEGKAGVEEIEQKAKLAKKMVR
jgi:hypothetical protein